LTDLENTVDDLREKKVNNITYRKDHQELTLTLDQLKKRLTHDENESR